MGASNIQTTINVTLYRGNGPFTSWFRMSIRFNNNGCQLFNITSFDTLDFFHRDIVSITDTHKKASTIFRLKMKCRVAPDCDAISQAHGQSRANKMCNTRFTFTMHKIMIHVLCKMDHVYGHEISCWMANVSTSTFCTLWSFVGCMS